MPNPPLTKKPIPRSVDGWRKEVAGVQRLLDQLPAQRRDQGTKWVQSMRRHYRARLDDLLDNAPPSLVKSGEARQARSE